MEPNPDMSRRDRLFGTGAPLFYKKPLRVVRGEGVWLYDIHGKRYLDMYNNVPCVGHCHPQVVAAIARQAATLNVHCRYLHKGVLDYAERLTKLHVKPLRSIVFSCTGTEANEVALHMARAATGGRGILCTDAAYHGNSATVGKLTRLKINPGPENTEARSFPVPDMHQPLQKGLSEDELKDQCLSQVQNAIDELTHAGIPLAAMIVCPIMANEGLPHIPRGFLAEAADVVHQAGGLVIADEVQSGFCRTGKWWGYEQTDFVPDIVTLGKPMGNGIPLAATVASTELVNTFRRHIRYFNTFAASPLQAAAGNAVLDIIEQERLWDHVAEVGNYLREELSKLKSGCEALAAVRGHGLFIGLEWVRDRDTRKPDTEGAVDVVNRLKEKGFLISNAGPSANILKIRPPLVFQKDHADLFLTAFEETLREIRPAEQL